MDRIAVSGVEKVPAARYWPDALTDTPRRRRTAARRRLGHGRGLLPRLLKACGHDLVMLTLPLYHAPPAALYCHQTGEQARAAVRALLPPGVPAWCKLEHGRRGLLHIHILTAAAAAAALPPGVRYTAISDSVGLLEYLGKPADARACRWRDERGHWHSPAYADLQAASVDLLAAKQARRLPRLSWPLNLPRMEGSRGAE